MASSRLTPKCSDGQRIFWETKGNVQHDRHPSPQKTCFETLFPAVKYDAEITEYRGIARVVVAHNYWWQHLSAEVAALSAQHRIPVNWYQ